MYHNFRNLQIWQRSLQLTNSVYDYCKDLPSTERFHIIDQMNRSSCSIPSNIAEGSAKRTNKHFAEFLATSLGSAYELETWLRICEQREYGDAAKRDALLKEVPQVQSMIFKYKEKIEGSSGKGGRNFFSLFSFSFLSLFT